MCILITLSSPSVRVMADAEMQKEGALQHPASALCRCPIGRWTSGYMQQVSLKAHKRICNDKMIHER